MKKQIVYKFNLSILKVFKKISIVSLLLIFTFAFSACKLVTIVKLEDNIEVDEKNGDLKSYVSEIWEDKAMPVFEEKAIDFTTAYDEIKNDYAIASKQYSSNPSNSGTFIVNGSGVVKKIDKESSNRKMTVDILNYGNDSDLVIQIGPIITGTDVRDSLPFIKFDDYENQIRFAQIAEALNDYIIEHTLTNAKLIEGQEIDFIVVFSLKNGEDPVIATPVYMHERG